jgi:hypothetical protein
VVPCAASPFIRVRAVALLTSKGGATFAMAGGAVDLAPFRARARRVRAATVPFGDVRVYLYVSDAADGLELWRVAPVHLKNS